MKLDFTPKVTLELSLQEAAHLRRLLLGSRPCPIGNDLISDLRALFEDLGQLAELSSRERPPL